MYGSSSDRVRFMKNFRFDIILQHTQKPQELQKYNCAFNRVHQQGCCDKVSPIAVKSYKYYYKVNHVSIS